MDVEDISVAERLGIGIGLVIVGSALDQPNLGLMTRLAALATLFGIGFLGAAFEPPLTNALGASQWDELGGLKQTAVLFVLAVVAIVLWFAVSTGQSALEAML